MKRGFASVAEIAIYIGVHLLAIVVSTVVMPLIIRGLLESEIRPTSNAVLFSGVTISYSIVSMIIFMLVFFGLRQLVEPSSGESDR